MKKYNWLAAAAVAMLVLACSNEKAPAQQAVANIDTSLGAIHDSAAKYSPDTLQSVEAQVGALKQSLARGDYKSVLANAPAVKASVASLKEEVDTKQTAADADVAKTKQQWRNLSAEVPKLIAGLQAQVDTLSKSKKLPKGLTKASFESAKAGVASLDPMWADATTTLGAGDYAGAAAKGQATKDKATELMQTLGMKPD
jgi:hypothetical protein